MNSPEEKQQWIEGQFFGVISQAAELDVSRGDVLDAFRMALGEYYPHPRRPKGDDEQEEG